MKISDLFQGIGNPISFYPDLVPIVGSHNAAIFLCQLCYWTGKQRNPKGWIYKTQEDWQLETELTAKEQKAARTLLCNKGFIQERFVGIPRRLEYRVLLDALDKLWDSWIPAMRIKFWLRNKLKEEATLVSRGLADETLEEIIKVLREGLTQARRNPKNAETIEKSIIDQTEIIERKGLNPTQNPYSTIGRFKEILEGEASHTQAEILAETSGAFLLYTENTQENSQEITPEITLPLPPETGEPEREKIRKNSRKEKTNPRSLGTNPRSIARPESEAQQELSQEENFLNTSVAETEFSPEIKSSARVEVVSTLEKPKRSTDVPWSTESPLRRVQREERAKTVDQDRPAEEWEVAPGQPHEAFVNYLADIWCLPKEKGGYGKHQGTAKGDVVSYLNNPEKRIAIAQHWKSFLERYDYELTMAKRVKESGGNPSLSSIFAVRATPSVEQIALKAAQLSDIPARLPDSTATPSSLPQFTPSFISASDESNRLLEATSEVPQAALGAITVNSSVQIAPAATERPEGAESAESYEVWKPKEFKEETEEEKARAKEAREKARALLAKFSMGKAPIERQGTKVTRAQVDEWLIDPVFRNDSTIQSKVERFLQENPELIGDRDASGNICWICDEW